MTQPNPLAVLAAGPADPAGVHVHLTPAAAHRTHELLTLTVDGEHCGLLIVPRRAAWEIASRLIDASPRISDLTAEVIGHVLWLRDEDFGLMIDDRPTEHLRRIIRVIGDATEDERRALSRAYPAYVLAVAIATGPDGLAALRELHATLIRTAAR